MATKKEIQEQNSLLDRQEQITKRLLELDELIADAKAKAKKGDDAALRTLKTLIAEKKKLTKEEAVSYSFQSKASDLSSLQHKLQQQIVQEIGKQGSGIMSATMGYYKSNQAAHKFMSTIIDLPNKQRLVNSAIEAATPMLEDNNMVIKQQGSDFADLISGSEETLDLTMKLAQNYDDIGSSDFTDMTGDADKNLKMRMREAEYIKNSLGPALQLAYESGEIDAKQFEDATANLKTMKSFANKNVKEAQALLATTEEQKIQANLASATIEYMSKPMQMLKAGMEALPFGGVASQFLNLEGIIGDFQSNIQATIASALDETTENGKKVNKMNFGLAVSNVSKAMTESIDRIKKGVEGMKTAFQGMNRMSSGVLSSLLPIVAILAVAGKLAQIFFKGTMETRKEFGLTFTEAAGLQKVLNTTTMEFKLMGVSAEDVKAGAQGIMDNMGGVSQVTRENLTTFAQLNSTLGISGENAGVLLSQMMAVGASSVQAAGAQLESVGALAQAGGVAPAKILEDVAGNADKFAEFAQDGGENIFKAAIGARQLGVNMATVTGAADALLDFESSINAQMEASMLTGKMINTDKARELALSGDLAGMQEEIVSQIGSQAEFEKMNVIQRQAMAKAFGVSVQDLSKMVANQEKLNNMTDVQKQRQDRIASVLQFLNTLFVKVVESFKPMIPLALGILSPFIALAGVLGGLLIGVGKVLEFIGSLGMLGDGIMVVVGAMISYNLYSKIMNMQIGKSKKMTLGKFIVDKKAYLMLQMEAMGKKRVIAQEYIQQSLTKKGMILRMRELGTMMLKNTQRLFGLKVQRGGMPLQLKTLKVKAMQTASTIKGMIADKAAAVGRVGLAIATGALTVAMKIGAAVAGVFNATLLANPIGAVVLGVVALIGALALLIKKFGFAKVIGTILKVAFFPIFGVIGTFKLIGSAIMGLKSLFSNFSAGVQTALKIAFAPFFLAYKIFQKAKNFIGSFFGGGDEGGAAAESSVTPESNAGKGGTLRQTVTETTIRGGQIVESKSQTKEITTRLDKLNSTGQQNVDASNRTAGQTQRLNSSIATG